MNQQIQSPVAHVPTLETEGAAYNAICPRMDASRPVPQALTVGKSYTAAELCDKLGIATESITTKPKYSGQSVLDAVNGIVGSAALVQPGEAVRKVDPVEIVPNPLAEAVNDLSYYVLNDIANDASGLFDVFGSDGVRQDFERRCDRVSTNEECAEVSVVLNTPLDAFDARKNLPRQVAKWARKFAVQLQEAADSIEAIDDARDRKAIRKLFKAGNSSQGLQPVG